MKEERENKMSKLQRLDLTKLENVLNSKYHLPLKQFIVEKQDYFKMKIKEVSMEVVLENKDLKVGVNLGQMDLANHEISVLFSVIQKLNEATPLLNSGIQLEEMDNYYYLKPNGVLLGNNSTEETIFDTIENLIEIVKNPTFLGFLTKYIES
jgi:hypothetical protein